MKDVFNFVKDLESKPAIIILTVLLCLSIFLIWQVTNHIPTQISGIKEDIKDLNEDLKGLNEKIEKNHNDLNNKIGKNHNEMKNLIIKYLSEKKK